MIDWLVDWLINGKMHAHEQMTDENKRELATYKAQLFGTN